MPSPVWAVLHSWGNLHSIIGIFQQPHLCRQVLSFQPHAEPETFSDLPRPPESMMCQGRNVSFGPVYSLSHCVGDPRQDPLYLPLQFTGARGTPPKSLRAWLCLSAVSWNLACRPWGRTRRIGISCSLPSLSSSPQEKQILFSSGHTWCLGMTSRVLIHSFIYSSSPFNNWDSFFLKFVF